MTARSERQPYPGLRSFAREQADLFFGRERVVGEMVERLAAARFVALLGPSGSGKSSLLRAGLIPALEAGRLRQAGSRWRVADLRPGRRPLLNLADALLRVGGEPPSPAPDEEQTKELRQKLAERPHAIADWCKAGNLPERTSLILIVDQLEDVFRPGVDEEEAEAFVTALLESVDTPPEEAPICVAVALRSEFLAGVVAFNRLSQAIDKGHILVPRLSEEELREAIVRPAARRKAEVEPALVTALVEDFATLDLQEPSGSALDRVARSGDALPRLQHVLSRLWLAAAERGKSDRLLRLDDYEEIGGLRDALAVDAQDALEALLPEHRAVAPTVFRALIEGASVAEAVGRPASFGELTELAHGEMVAVREVVEAFRAPGRGFLLPARPEPLEASTRIRITHESLIRQWESCAVWLRDEVAAAAAWRRLADRAERHRRGPASVVSGLEFETLEEWWNKERPTPLWVRRYGGDLELAQSLLERSRQARAAGERFEAEQRGKNLRNRLLAFAAVVTLCIIAPLAVFSSYSAIRANEEAEHARTAEMAAEKARNVADAARQEAAQDRELAEAAEREAEQERQRAASEQARAEEERNATLAAQAETEQAKREIEAERARTEQERLRALAAIEEATAAGVARDRADGERRAALVERDEAQRRIQQAETARDLAELGRQHAVTARDIAVENAATAVAERTRAEEQRVEAVAAAESANQAKIEAERRRLEALTAQASAIHRAALAATERDRANEERAQALAAADVAGTEKDKADKAREDALALRQDAFDQAAAAEADRSQAEEDRRQAISAAESAAAEKAKAEQERAQALAAQEAASERAVAAEAERDRALDERDQALASRQDALHQAATAEAAQAQAENERRQALAAADAATAGQQRAEDERQAALDAQQAAIEQAKAAGSERDKAEAERRQAIAAAEAASAARERAEQDRQQALAAQRQAAEQLASAEAARAKAEAERQGAIAARDEALQAAQEATELADKERLRALAAIDQAGATEAELKRANDELAKTLAALDVALAEKERAEEERLRALAAQGQPAGQTAE